MATRAKRVPKLVSVSVRLFADDIELLKARAMEARSKWHTDLRHLVHRALEGQRHFGELK